MISITSLVNVAKSISFPSTKLFIRRNHSYLTLAFIHKHKFIGSSLYPLPSLPIVPNVPYNKKRNKVGNILLLSAIISSPTS